MGHFQNTVNFLIFAFVLFYSQYSIKNVKSWGLGGIKCDWYKKLEGFSEIFKGQVEARLLLSTKHHIEPFEINRSILTNSSILREIGFDKEKNSIVIIHGWRSSTTKEWVSAMTRKLHVIKDVNIFLVDWTNTASSLNYVKVAENLPAVADIVYELFRDVQFETWNRINTKGILWNHLYFIGHSLGAHLSGHIAHLMKQSGDDFWKIERITGLDPAKPCFVDTNTEDHYKLDKSDAAFVDVIHSNIGYNSDAFSLGLNKPIGHIDFFIDGGTLQPKCEKLEYFEAIICSHKVSHDLYTQLLTTSTSNNCKLYGHQWDGSYNSAMKIFNDVKNDEACIDCPQMGINAINSIQRGKFLVLTSELKNECASYNDPLYVKEAIKSSK
ncbi:lipase member H-like [Copidosoma floridanum]|uniref:lipase member H-like n=1 Tax=Copidosoma floridanum TaxID=29053 RepID=UPI0006C9B9C3|nr:lipase member H-like [Copidosoma floridanum]